MTKQVTNQFQNRVNTKSNQYENALQTSFKTQTSHKLQSQTQVSIKFPNNIELRHKQVAKRYTHVAETVSNTFDTHLNNLPNTLQPI